MRWAFFFLLIVNIAFFGLTQLAAGRNLESAKDHQPINPDKITLVGPQVPANASGTPSASSAPVNAIVCFQWGVFAGKDRERAQVALQKLQLGDKVVQQSVSVPSRYWVYIPPQKLKQDAEKKISELKSLGIADYELIKDDGKWKYAISLGVFQTEEASAKYLAQLRQKGVKSAIVGPRLNDDAEVTFLIKDASSDLATQLVALKQDFQGSELKAVGCK